MQSSGNLGGFGDALVNAAFQSMISGVGLQMTYLFGSPGQIENDANNGSSVYLPNDFQMQYNNGQTQIKW